MSLDQVARAEELRSIASKLGITINELGRRIGEDESNFRRMARPTETGRRATDEVIFKARALIDANAIDDMIAGYGDASGRRYVIRTASPPCVAIMATRDKIERVIWSGSTPAKATRDLIEDMIIKASLRGYHRDYSAGRG